MTSQNKYNRTESDLHEYYTQARSVMAHLGYEVPVIPVSINNRLSSVLGRYFRGDNRIEISGKYFRNASTQDIMSTIVHEICHQVSSTAGHSKEWKVIANNVSQNTPYSITRLHELDRETLSALQKDKPYILECVNCGDRCGYTKQTKVYKDYINYRCGCCGGKLKQVTK